MVWEKLTKNTKVISKILDKNYDEHIGGTAINVGNPHVVFFVDDNEKMESQKKDNENGLYIVSTPIGKLDNQQLYYQSLHLQGKLFSVRATILKFLSDFADLIICWPILPIHPVIAKLIFFI